MQFSNEEHLPSCHDILDLFKVQVQKVANMHILYVKALPKDNLCVSEFPHQKVSGCVWIPVLIEVPVHLV